MVGWEGEVVLLRRAVVRRIGSEPPVAVVEGVRRDGRRAAGVCLGLRGLRAGVVKLEWDINVV